MLPAMWRPRSRQSRAHRLTRLRPATRRGPPRLLRDYLARHGVASELLARTPDRANLVARLPGGDGPSLLLMAHTDTVLADPEEWERDPWSGDLVDGEVWGRGALDMKGHVADGGRGVRLARP